MIHELFGNPLFQTIAGGVLGGVSANRQNAANLDANRQNIIAQRANQDKALANTLNFETPTTLGSQLPGGGGKVEFRPGSGSAIQAAGDPARAQTVNDAFANAQRTVPDMATANSIIAERNALGQGRFDQGLGDLLATLSRKDRDNNPSLQGPAVREVGLYADANRLGSREDAISLFHEAGINDQKLLEAIRNANAQQAPTLTTAGNQAGNLVVQTPPVPNAPDVGSVIPFAAGGNIIQQLQAQEGQRAQDEQRNAILRAFLGNQGGFGGGTRNFDNFLSNTSRIRE